MTAERAEAGRVPEGFRRKALLVTAALWLLQYLVLAFRALFIPDADLELALKRAAWLLVGFALCGLLYLLIERLSRVRFVYQVVITLAIAIPVSLIFSVVNALIYYGTPGEWSWIAGHVDMSIHWLWFFFAWAAIILALNYSMRAAQEEKARVDAQILAHSAQMRALRYQLNPHFLFNTLNSIAALSLDGKAEIAEQMLVRLSAFLRSGLETDPLDEVRLEDEIKLQQLYLEIERVRFSDRLNVEVEIPSGLGDALVPSFILQPLVENAIKYGVSPSRSRTTVSIAALAEGDMLSLSVEDDSEASPTGGGTGVGLANIQARLAAQFGARFRLVSGPRHPHGYFAEMRFPLRFA